MQVPAGQRGDLLVFVAGMADITALREALEPYAAQSRRWILLPLHSALSVEEQDKARAAPPAVARAPHTCAQGSAAAAASP